MTHDEALAIVASLKLPNRPFIDGAYREALEPVPFTSTNPATGEVLAQIEGGGVADLDAAVAVAKKTFEAGVWSAMHPSERKAVLLRFAELIRDNLEELSVTQPWVSSGFLVGSGGETRLEPRRDPPLGTVPRNALRASG